MQASIPKETGIPASLRNILKRFETLGISWMCFKLHSICKVDQIARECQACTFILLRCHNVRSSGALAFAAGSFCVCLCYRPLHCKATCHHLPSQAVLFDMFVSFQDGFTLPTSFSMTEIKRAILFRKFHKDYLAIYETEERGGVLSRRNQQQVRRSRSKFKDTSILHHLGTNCYHSWTEWAQICKRGVIYAWTFDSTEESVLHDRPRWNNRHMRTYDRAVWGELMHFTVDMIPKEDE